MTANEERLLPITLEGRRIHFRNFAGAPTRFNPNGGIRDFIVFLDPEEAKAMEADGWNIKYLNPREEGDEPAPILKVKVKYPTGESRAKPPRVIMITSRGRTTLKEDMLEILDWADIENVDMIIRGWRWEIGGKTGVSAYLTAIYVTIREDALERKYADVPEVGGGIVVPEEPF